MIGVHYVGLLTIRNCWCMIRHMATQRLSQRFLSALWREQDAAGLTIGQLARLLEIDQSNLKGMREGRGGRGNRLTVDLAERAMDRFPSLRSLFCVR